MANTNFYQIKVKKVQKETRLAVIVELDIPKELEETFSFKPGQYLTFKQVIEGEEVRRSFSICSNPFGITWKVGIKKVTGGLFSTWANDILIAGDTLEVMPPLGKFYPDLKPENQKNYMAIAAGSGITPILSIISATLEAEPKSKYTLVYGNQSRSTIMFKEDLEALKDKYLNRLSLYHILSREKTDAQIQYGRIDSPKCDELFKTLIDIYQMDEFFICGPEEMSLTAKEYLISKGIEKQKIQLELFTTNRKATQSKKVHFAQLETLPTSRVTVRHDGIENSFNLAYDSDAILDAALHEGIELPFACKGGMCCTCKAKLVSGEVDMEVHYGLEQDEIEAGYILTCQSHPKTAEVVVDFDAR